MFHSESYFLSEDNDFEFQLATPFKLNRSSLVESLADTTFLCSMLLSWLIFAHSVRQISRPFYQFYLAKVALVAGIFITTNSTLLIDYLDLTVKVGEKVRPVVLNQTYESKISIESKIDF